MENKKGLFAKFIVLGGTKTGGVGTTLPDREEVPINSEGSVEGFIARRGKRRSAEGFLQPVT